MAAGRSRRPPRKPVRRATTAPTDLQVREAAEATYSASAPAVTVSPEETRYHEFIELCPDPILVHSHEHILYVNAAAVTLFGAQQAAELIGHSIWELIPTDFHATVRERLAHIRRAGRVPYISEMQLYRRDGQLITVEVTGAALTYAGHQAIQTVLRDVTERKRIEQALRESEERYRNLFENANDAIASFTHDGIIETVNSGAEVLLGWSREELIGQHYSKVATPTAQAQAADRTRRFLAGEDLPSIFSIDLVRKDGTIVPVEARTRAIYDQHKQLQGFQGIFRDMTERKKGEERLLASQRLQELIADTVPDILYLYDMLEQRLVYINHRVFTVLGYPVDSLRDHVGPLFADLLHPDDRELFEARSAKFSSVGEQELIETDFRVRHANGEWRTLHSREQVARRTGSGEPLQILGIAQDITVRKRLAQKFGAFTLERQQVGTRLRAFRRQLGLSQTDFGKQFGGYNQRQIFSYESGQADIPITLLIAIHNRGYPLEAVLGTGTKAIAEDTIQYLNSSYRARHLMSRFAAVMAELLAHDQQMVDRILTELGSPLKEPTNHMRQLFALLADLDVLLENQR